MVSATAAGARQPAPARTGADVGHPEQLIDGMLMIIGLVVVLALIAIFVIFDDDEEDLPTSP